MGGSRTWVSNANYRVLPPPGQPFRPSILVQCRCTIRRLARIGGQNANLMNGWSLALVECGPGTNFLVLGGDPAESSLTLTAVPAAARPMHELALHVIATAQGFILMAPC